MQRDKLARIVVLSAFAALMSCRGCGDQGPKAIVELAGVDAGAAFVVKDINLLLKNVDGFLTRATRKTGTAAIDRIKEGMAKQLGVDLFMPENWEKIGIDAKSGMLVFTEGTSTEPLLAVAVKDSTRFTEALTALMKKLDGASTVSDEKSGSFTIKTAGRPFGNDVAPALHWVFVGKYALVARADGRASLDKALARLGAPKDPKAPATKSLNDDPVYQSLSQKVEGGDVQVFVRASAATELLQEGQSSLSRGAISSVKVSGEGFSGEMFIDAALPNLEQAMAGDAPLDLAKLVEQDAVLLALTRHARPQSVQALKADPTAAKLVNQALSPLGQATGLNPETEILPLLAGPLTLSVHLLDLAGLPAALQGRRSIAAVLEFVHVVITAELKDAKAMTELLIRSQKGLQERGINVTQGTQQVGKATATTFYPGQSQKLGWAVFGNHYVYAAGQGRLDRALKMVAGEGTSVLDALKSGAAAKLADQKGATVVALRSNALADSAARMAASGGAGMAAIIGGALDVVRTLGDIGVSLTGEKEGFRIKARETLQ